MAVALCEGKDTLDQVPRDESSGDDVYGQIASQDFESIAEDKDLSYIRNVSSDITYVMGLKPSDPNFEEETNIDAAMNGYNILMGNPNNAGDDPGMRHRIFSFMIANDRYLKGYTTRDIAEGEQRETITHSTTADSYFKQLEKSQTTGSGITSGLDWDVAVTVPVEGVEVSGSTTIPKFMDNKYGSSKASLDIEKSFTERQVSIHQSSQKYWEYAVELNPTDPPPFSQGFINTVRELHGAISGNEHDQKTAAHHLLDNYGTHFMLKTQMGRKATLMQKYSSSMAIKHTLKERNECTSKSFEFNLGGFIGIKKQSEDCKLSSEASGHFSSDDFVITTIYTTGEKNLPVPLEIKFSPILNLFSNLYMKDLKTENGNPIDYDGILTTFLSKIYIGACMRYINDEKQCKNGMKGCGWDDTCNRETETCQNTYDRNKQVIGFVCHQECSVDLFENSYYGGRKDTQFGSVDKLNNFNDMTSSVKPRSGCCVDLYTDSSFMADVFKTCENVDHFSNNYWNDQFSSLKVYPKPDVTYKTSENRMTFDAARSYCRFMGGDLAVDGLQDWGQRMGIVHDLPYNSAYWIGLTDMQIETSWQWIRKPKSGCTNIFWAPGEPNNNSGGVEEDCAVIDALKGWKTNDVPCSFINYAICEI